MTERKPWTRRRQQRVEEGAYPQTMRDLAAAHRALVIELLDDTWSVDDLEDLQERVRREWEADG